MFGYHRIKGCKNRRETVNISVKREHWLTSICNYHVLSLGCEEAVKVVLFFHALRKVLEVVVPGGGRAPL